MVNRRALNLHRLAHIRVVAQDLVQNIALQKPHWDRLVFWQNFKQLTLLAMLTRVLTVAHRVAQT